MLIRLCDKFHALIYLIVWVNIFAKWEEGYNRLRNRDDFFASESWKAENRIDFSRGGLSIPESSISCQTCFPQLEGSWHCPGSMRWTRKSETDFPTRTLVWLLRARERGKLCLAVSCVSYGLFHSMGIAISIFWLTIFNFQFFFLFKQIK